MIKKSNYTLFVKDGDNLIIFNTLRECFLLVPINRSSDYVEIFENPELYKDDFNKFITAMLELGFMVHDDTDEIAAVKKKYGNKRRPGHYHLMILPTYQCNLRCWYCTQKHQDLWMSDETKERIKRLIDIKVQDPTIHVFDLSWFGGEPLMCYDIVAQLTAYTSQAARANGKQFNCNITTNGTLLTKTRIKALSDAGVTHYQITVDGPRDIHNKVKVLGNRSAFDVTLTNINEIAKDATVTLRHNYTAETLDADRLLSDLESVLDKSILRNVVFRPYKVWQETESADLTRRANELYLKSVDKGIPSKLFFPDLCYVDYYQFDCVFPNGRVGKCDNLDPKDLPGELMADGSIAWNMQEAKYSVPMLFESVISYECESCKYLPICWGPCAVKRESMWRNKNRISCYLTDCKMMMDQYVKNFVINKKHETVDDFHNNVLHK